MIGFRVMEKKLIAFMEIFFVMITHLSREKEKKLCRVCGKIRIPYLVNQERSSVEIDQS